MTLITIVDNNILSWLQIFSTIHHHSHFIVYNNIHHPFKKEYSNLEFSNLMPIISQDMDRVRVFIRFERLKRTFSKIIFVACKISVSIDVLYHCNLTRPKSLVDAIFRCF